MADDTTGREHLVTRNVAMLAVFKRLSKIWPKAFHSNAWDGLSEIWLDSLKGVDTDALEPAARALLTDAPSTWPPKPWEFAKFARQWQAKRVSDGAHSTRSSTAPTGILDGARPFWFERPTADGTGVTIAGAFALASGGSVGIAETEMDKLLCGETLWGWGSAHHERVA